MTVTIMMPDEMENQLKHKAEKSHLSLEEFILDLLADALETETPSPTPEEVVARIKATPGNPNSLRPASGSLAEALRHAPDDPDFDLAAWNREWAAVEGELQTVTRANDLAEGRI
jgi:hypothetical protein